MCWERLRKSWEKIEARREFQFLEVIGTNILANEVVRHFSNLTTKEFCESAKRVLLREKSLILIHHSTCRESIYKIGESAETLLR